MKRFIRPKIEVAEFVIENILTTSGIMNSLNEFSSENGNAPVYKVERSNLTEITSVLFES